MKDIALIDFEASSLDENSYPIEVGLALVRDGVLESWSSLIRPTSEWVRRDAWSRRSERAHGISREMLADAPAPVPVMRELNQQAAGFQTLYCDGGWYDEHWLSELAAASGETPFFHLADVQLLLTETQRARFKELRASTPAPHRAEADARRLAEMILASLGN